MANTFYVRTGDKKQYVEAKFLTDIHGNFVVSSNQIQRSYNLFDAGHNSIGTNTNGYVIVPANFDIKTTIEFGHSNWWLNLTPQTEIAAMARFANAFYPRKGWLDIQTHYNGTSGDNVPAFRDGASYIFGVAGHAAGFLLNTLKWGGGAVNLWQESKGNVKDTSGDAYNSRENVTSMTDGYQAQQNRIFGQNLSSPPSSMFGDAGNNANSSAGATPPPAASNASTPGFSSQIANALSTARESAVPALSRLGKYVGDNLIITPAEALHSGPLLRAPTAPDLSGNEAQGIATNRRVRYLGRRIVNQSSASAFDAAASDRQDTFSDRFGNWTFSSPEGITPRNPNLPVPPPEPRRPLGIFSGKPMPLWTTPVPIGGLLDNSNASSNIDWFTALAGASGSDKKSPASVFDNGAPAVPFVPSDDASFSGGLPGRLAAFLAGTMNEAQTPPPPLQDGAQGISSGKSVPRLVRVNGDNSPASVSDMGALAAPIVPSDDASFSGGLAAWVAALAGVGPQSPNQFAAPPLDDGLRGFYCDDPTQPRDDADLQALDARLSRSGDIKDAVALYKARKSSRC